MDEGRVVTCFLIHRGPDGDRLLLVRRSDRVGAYRGRWAAISGTVETTPDEQALTEIREETGLGLGHVRRLARGRPLVAEDADLNRRWIVHPYLFAVEDPAAVACEAVMGPMLPVPAQPPANRPPPTHQPHSSHPSAPAGRPPRVPGPAPPARDR